MAVTPPATSRKYPKPRDAVLGALRANPDKWLAPKDVVALIKERDEFDTGMKSGSNGYGVALRRLVAHPKYPVRLEAGSYRYETTASYLTQSLEYANRDGDLS